MNTNGESEAPDITELIATIQKMAAEKQSRTFKSVGLSDFSARDRTDPNRADTAPAQVDATHQVSDNSDVPRTMRAMTDLHVSKLAKLASQAWPGLKVHQAVQSAPSLLGNTADSGADSGYGPLLSPALRPAGLLSSNPMMPAASRLLDPRLGVAQATNQSPSANVSTLPSASGTHVPETHSTPLALPEHAPPQSTFAQDSGRPGVKGSGDEISAHLLRPLIMQWVNDNMPHIVEDALNIESNSTDQ